ncbi:MAG: glutaredoxin domain-containing protein [Candidatus Cloacimonetes bacterium]|nr:glutaredoxin domain-containing protein [Candidatus Cloacimonadota bacterium]
MKANIVIFGTPTCAWCSKVKDYISKKGLTYKYIDVSRDERALKDMISKTGKQGVPQLWINNRPIVGFDREKIDRMINESK